MSTARPLNADSFDVEAVRSHFDFPRTGHIVTNNAASTQPPRELLQLHHALAPQYENVPRGQSSASMHATRLFEAAFDDIDPIALATALNEAGVEARGGCHCATLAHQALAIEASCRLSFCLYNTEAEIDRVVDALAGIVSARRDRYARPHAPAGPNSMSLPAARQPAFRGSLS